MKTLLILLRLTSLLALLATGGLAFSQDATPPPRGASVTVTPDIIKARLKEVEASSDLDENTQKTLIESYRKALSNLETEAAHNANATAFGEARETAPGETAKLRQQLEKAERELPEVTLDVTAESPLTEVEQHLLNEKANQAAVDAKLAGLEDQLSAELERPAGIRQRLTEARRIQENLGEEFKQPPPPGEPPMLTEARQWNLKSRWLSLNAELRMLDQELLSNSMRVELIKVQRDHAARSNQRIAERIRLLEELAAGLRQSEAEQARTEAEVARAEVEGKHPVIRQLAEKNAAMSEELATISTELAEISSGDQKANSRAKAIEEEFRSTRQKLEVAGLSQALGQVLLEQRRLLPNVGGYRKQARIRERLIAENALRQIQHSEERKHLGNIPAYVEALIADLPPEEMEQVRSDLTGLAHNRRDLLDKAVTMDEAYLRALAELDFAQRRLLDTVESYDDFLAERLLWIRSSAPMSAEVLPETLVQIYQILSPVHWFEVLEVLVYEATHSLVPAVALLLFTLLLVKMGKMRAALQATGRKIIKPRSDRFTFTLQALGLTLLMALPWPLLLAAIGLQLSGSLETTDFSRTVGRGLTLVAPGFFYLRAFRLLCIPGGLAAAHFRWPEPSLKQLRGRIRHLMWTFLPAGFVTVVAVNFSTAGSSAYGGGLARIAFAVVMIALSLFFYRLFGPGQKTLDDLMSQHPDSVLVRLRNLWLALALILPLILIGLAFAGYLYTAGILTGSLVATLWLLLGFIILHQLAVRWLLMTRRRFAFEAALERRRAALENHEADQADSGGDIAAVEEPEIDLVALNEESRKLLNTLIPFSALLGLWFIWSDVVPAFGMLDQVSLWHHTKVVAGEEQLVPVTLADLALALLIAAVTIVASKRFPALLEIALLRRLSVTSGGRYAATTLSRYSIAAIGTLLVLSTIGASWSQVQWLAAALSVGIGFGLQEIVANFISGLIILFERPIRVGDVVTVGDTDGVVTRIQIRATTIRNWDRQELLVPNKEFITGRLLNWSLSDQTTRIKIPVGVAYGSDVEKAMKLMHEAAAQDERVLAEPAPSIVFDAFGDNALNLVLRCFVGDQDHRMPAITALHQAINHKFNDADIVIAFPQRDVHLDTSQPLDIRIRRDDPSPDGDPA